MLFAVTAGLRISETIAIKYSNIDFLNNKLSVESQLGRTITNEGIPGENLLIQEKTDQNAQQCERSTFGRFCN